MKYFNLLFSLFFVGFSNIALAVDEAMLTKKLQVLIPDEKPDAITETAVKGLYEVTYGPQIFYISEDGRYLMKGNLLDIDQMKNITAERHAELTRDVIASVDEDQMIVFPAKNEKHRVTVFTDIDCGYCRKLHNEMEQLNAKGISVQYMFFPRSGPNTPSYFKAQSVWCAKNQQQALTDSKNGKEVEEKRCDNPIDEHMKLVQMLGLNGTPALVLESGQVLPGYRPADALAAMLDGETPIR